MDEWMNEYPVLFFKSRDPSFKSAWFGWGPNTLRSFYHFPFPIPKSPPKSSVVLSKSPRKTSTTTLTGSWRAPPSLYSFVSLLSTTSDLIVKLLFPLGTESRPLDCPSGLIYEIQWVFPKPLWHCEYQALWVLPCPSRIKQVAKACKQSAISHHSSLGD